MDPLYVQVRDSLQQGQVINMPPGTTMQQLDDALLEARQEQMFGNIVDNVNASIQKKLIEWKNNLQEQAGGYKSRRNRRSKRRRSKKNRK
jgi:hypothetical protein